MRPARSGDVGVVLMAEYVPDLGEVEGLVAPLDFQFMQCTAAVITHGGSLR